MGSTETTSISVAVSSSVLGLSVGVVECSLSALKAVVEGEMKLEEDEGAPGSRSRFGGGGGWGGVQVTSV